MNSLPLLKSCFFLCPHLEWWAGMKSLKGGLWVSPVHEITLRILNVAPDLYSWLPARTGTLERATCPQTEVHLIYTLHSIRGVGWGSNTAGKGTLCSESWGHAAFSLLPPLFLQGGLVSLQVMKLSFSVVDTLLCPSSISFPLDLRIWKQIHFNDLRQFNLGSLLFQRKPPKPIMFVSLSTPEHPEGVQYILVGEERHNKRKLVTEEGKK